MNKNSSPNKKPKISSAGIRKPQNCHPKILFKKTENDFSNQNDEKMQIVWLPEKMNFNMEETENKTFYIDEPREVLRKRQSNTRHLSLIYALRNKYIIENGKSRVLTKILRPKNKNDHKLQLAEKAFQNNQPKRNSVFNPRSKEFLKKPVQSKPTTNKTEDVSSISSPKNSIHIILDENLILKSKKNFQNYDQQGSIDSEDLEIFQNEIDLERNGRSQIEKRIYEWLDSENIKMVLVDQRAKYNEQLQKNLNTFKKKKLDFNPEGNMSPILKRRFEGGLTNPILRSLKLNNFGMCSSSDNLLKILNVDMEIN